MIYLLGGTPRTGKSILARRINVSRDIAAVSTDLLRGVLMMVDDELGEAMHANDPEREANAFYRHLRQTVACLQIQQPDALVEGVGFLPRHIVQLRRELDVDIRGCFLGRSTATPADLFGHGTDHRIYDALGPTQQTNVAHAIVAWTALLADDCHQHGLPLIDLAQDGFSQSLRAAEAALFAAP